MTVVIRRDGKLYWRHFRKPDQEVRMGRMTEQQFLDSSRFKFNCVRVVGVDGSPEPVLPDEVRFPRLKIAFLPDGEQVYQFARDDESALID